MKLLLGVLFLTFASHAQSEIPSNTGDELEERSQIRALARKAFFEQDYESLENQLGSYRSSQSLTSSGSSKLSWFYRAIYEIFGNYEPRDEQPWYMVNTIVKEWNEAYPDSDGAFLVGASIQLARASAIRGTDYAHQVSERNMAEFRRKTRAVTTQLLSRPDIGARDPRWYQLLGWAYRSIGVDEAEFRRKMDEGFERFPFYDDLYFVAAEYYKPIWHGSRQRLHEFALEAVEMTADERGKELYARIYWAASVSSKGKYYFQYPEADWNTMSEGIDDVIEKHPSQWNINHFAFFACLTGDYAKASELVDLIVEPAITRAWVRIDNFGLCKRRIIQYQATVANDS